MVDALEAYLRVASPGGPAMTSPLESIAGAILGDDSAAATPSPAPPEPEVPEPPT